MIQNVTAKKRCSFSTMRTEKEGMIMMHIIILHEGCKKGSFTDLHFTIGLKYR